MSLKRQLQKEATKNKIINSAYDVYSTHGFKATTSMIAKKANVAHGTVFAHFSSVDELLISLIENFGNTITIETNNLIEENSNIQKFLTGYIKILSKYENFYINIISDKNILPKEAKLIFANIQSNIAFHFSEIIENECTKDIPMHMMFNTWVGLVHYYLLNKELFSPSSPVLSRYGSELLTTFIELIKEN